MDALAISYPFPLPLPLVSGAAYPAPLCGQGSLCGVFAAITLHAGAPCLCRHTLWTQTLHLVMPLRIMPQLFVLAEDLQVNT